MWGWVSVIVLLKVSQGHFIGSRHRFLLLLFFFPLCLLLFIFRHRRAARSCSSPTSTSSTKHLVLSITYQTSETTFVLFYFYLVDEQRGLKIQESSIQSKIELVDRSFVRSSDRLRLQRSSTYGGGGGARLQCNSSSSFVEVQHDGRHGRGNTSSTQLITASITAAVAI